MRNTFPSLLPSFSHTFSSCLIEGWSVPPRRSLEGQYVVVLSLSPSPLPFSHPLQGHAKPNASDGLQTSLYRILAAVTQPGTLIDLRRSWISQIRQELVRNLHRQYGNMIRLSCRTGAPFRSALSLLCRPRPTGWSTLITLSHTHIYFSPTSTVLMGSSPVSLPRPRMNLRKLPRSSLNTPIEALQGLANAAAEAAAAPSFSASQFVRYNS